MIYTAYNDLAEIIQKYLFGGMMETRCTDANKFMDIEPCTIYESKVHTIWICMATVLQQLQIFRHGSSCRFAKTNEF